MSSKELGTPLPHPEQVVEKAHWFLERDFKRTDAQFSIARPGGFDLISPSERIYITTPGSVDSEEIITGILGSHAVLNTREYGENFAVYDVPRGTRPLRKTLKSSPYARPYMQSLAVRSLKFLDALASVDRQAFGVELEDIAITHNGENDGDDIYLTVIPPLEIPTNPAVTEQGTKRFIAQTKRRIIGSLAVETSVTKAYKDLAEKNQHRTRPFKIDELAKYFTSEKGGQDGTA